MTTFLEIIGFGLLGYLFGSLSFALWITRLVKGVDVREGGSGHATATNTMRTAGWGAFVVVLILDIGKGYIPVWMSAYFSDSNWLVGLVAMLVVVGHCWPIFSEFKGGMGLATAGGTILAISPIAFLLGVGILIALTLILHHSARAAVVLGASLPLIFWGIGWRGELIWATLGIGIVISIRFFSDWNRQYRELWLDRESKNF